MKGASRNLPTLFYAPKRFFAARAEDESGNLAATAFSLAFLLAGAMLDRWWYQLGWSFETGRESLLRAPLPVYLLIQAGLLALVQPMEAVLVHLMLQALGRARASFGATYRVCAYSMAGAVFNVIPWVGTTLGVFAAIGLLVIGVRETHRTSIGSAITVTLVGWMRLMVITVVVVVGAYVALRHR